MTKATTISQRDRIVDNYGKFCRPLLTQLFKSIELDAVYQKAIGNYLWRIDKENNFVKVLDLAGGYGANLFGHNHPDIKSTLIELYDRDVPFLAQSSCRSGAAKLSKKLNRYTSGEYITIFTNSGTETVEASLKHAYFKYKKPIILAIKGAFHGKTLGAIQVTSAFNAPFSNLGFKVFFLDMKDSKTWEKAEKIMKNVSALIFEPILGEGGIKVVPENLVEWIIQMRKQHDFSLIVDEIQTGLGRTGQFFASSVYGIQPDCICLSKSLGGGLVKVGALMIDKNHFVKEFSLIHTSTFAEDDSSSFVAIKALEILEKDDLMDRCTSQGAYILKKLNKLQAQFPKQVKSIRGKGLMIGVEFFDFQDSSSNMLHVLSIQNYLGYVYAAYLLNVHNIRVAPTLSQPNTIRIAPSAYITKQEINVFISAFHHLCQVLLDEDVIKLTCFSNNLVYKSKVSFKPRKTRRECPRVSNKVAFLGHFIKAQDAILWDPALAQIKASKLNNYLSKTSSILNPAILDQVHVKSITGDEVHLSFIGLNLTSKEIVKSMKHRETKWITDKIEIAVQMAKDIGCKVVGFGGYTSIITNNCYKLRKHTDIGLTTGNSLTVGMGKLSILQASKKQNIQLDKSTLGVVGATGNIASVYSIIMAPVVKKIILIVRDLEAPKLRSLVQNIKKQAPDTIIKTSNKLQDLDTCSVILSASNSNEPIIFPEHLQRNPIVICDIALPFDVSPEVYIKRPNALVIKGGIVKLPPVFSNEEFNISGIPLDHGTAFACMSETIIMGLEGIQTNGSYGRIAHFQVNEMMTLAKKHGFSLAKSKTERSY